MRRTVRKKAKTYHAMLISSVRGLLLKSRVQHEQQVMHTGGEVPRLSGGQRETQVLLMISGPPICKNCFELQPIARWKVTATFNPRLAETQTLPFSRSVTKASLSRKSPTSRWTIPPTSGPNSAAPERFTGYLGTQLRIDVWFWVVGCFG